MGTRPLTVTIASLVIAAQGLAIFGLTVWSAFQMFGAGEALLNTGVQIAMLAIYVIFGLSYLIVGHFMFRGKSWTRSAAVAIQLMMVILAFSFFTADNPLANVIGTLMLLSGAVVIGSLFSTSAGYFLGREAPQPTQASESKNN